MPTMSTEISKQEEFVLRTLEERNIRFVRLWFTDVLGFLKSVAIAPAELENAFAEGIGFDGSAIGALKLQVLLVCSVTS
jgi:glutamine synthetase